MKMMTKMLTAGAALALVLSFAAPAGAACGTFAQITTNNGGWSHIINTEFQDFITDADGVTTLGNLAGYYGPYTFSYDAAVPAPAPLSPNGSISFWRATTGDPAVGVGDDNGVYDMIATGGFYFTGYTAGPYALGGYLGGGRVFSSFGATGVDGCVEANSCMCLLVTDQNGMSSDWAILGGLSNANFDSFIDIGGTDGNNNLAPILMASVPAPAIDGSARDAVSFDVRLDVSVPASSAGVYTQDGCACGPTGYKVLQQILPRGSQPPSDRAAGWTEPNVAAIDGGGPQGVTPLGGTVRIDSLCGASNSDVYLATQLFFDSNFATSVVSSNSTRVECGPSLADPDDKPQPIRPRGDRPTRPKRR